MKGYIEVSSRKGGVGTTTTACAIALSLESMGNTVLILDTTGTDSVSATLGVNAPMTSSHEFKNISVRSIHVEGKDIVTNRNYDYVVIDAGNKMFNYTDREGHDESSNIKRVGVVRNEYLALRNMVHYPVDLFVSFTIEGNALQSSDVRNVLSKEVIDTPMNSAVARSIDAGLFPSRWESLFSEFSHKIVHSLMAVAS